MCSCLVSTPTFHMRDPIKSGMRTYEGIMFGLPLFHFWINYFFHLFSKLMLLTHKNFTCCCLLVKNLFKNVTHFPKVACHRLQLPLLALQCSLHCFSKDLFYFDHYLWHKCLCIWSIMLYSSTYFVIKCCFLFSFCCCCFSPSEGFCTFKKKFNVNKIM